jgi:RNA polymerase sigma-54 factor
MVTNSLQLKQKQTLNLSLKLWIPIIQADLQELETQVNRYSYNNPFLSNLKKSNYKKFDDLDANYLENISIYQQSMYDELEDQIEPPLFPTPNSQKIAFEIISMLNQEGYFEATPKEIEQIAYQNSVTIDFVESIRKRFKYLQPSGIGAKDLEESYIFQLSQLDPDEVDDELNEFVKKLISNLKKMDKFHKHHRFEEAKNIIKKFKSPPAVDFLDEQMTIIPDFFVDVGDDINIKINSEYYPDVMVTDPFNVKNSEKKEKNIAKNDDLKEKLKEARDLVNLLELRKSTLYKLILIIVEKQIGFFIGSELKPLTMKEVADELGFEESTISRAVANKHIQTERGVFSLKFFFTNAVSKNLSSAEIKNYIDMLVKNENTEIPLKDQDIADLVKKRYSINIVRRTITKYRKILNIPSSKERKKIYKLN